MGKAVFEEGRLRELREWVEHRYDPGHYTGGRLHPLLTGRRPNKYGYVLLFGGLMMILFSILSPEHILYWYNLTLQMGVALLAIAAGLKLIRKPRSRSRKKEDR